MSYDYLWHIALILISTKLFGLITRRFQMPQVVGALLAGLFLGPAFGLNWIQSTDMLSKLAELGVIIIMFSAGMGTDVQELKKSGKSGFLVAMMGVLAPLGMGTLLAYAFNRGEFATGGNTMLQNIFVGVILTATSVSITVETLKEMGKLQTKVGNTILAAAIIDDILGLIALTIVTSLGGADVNVWMVLLKIALYFVFAAVAWFVIRKAFDWYVKKMKSKNLQRYSITAFVICLIMSYLAEEVFGVADIIGAFTAGLIISGTPKGDYISSKFVPIQYLFLTPIFFASIGLKVKIDTMSWTILIFAVLLSIVAILSKLIGCGLGAKCYGFTNKEALQTGLGMACRGEVALIVANKGMAMGLLPEAFFGPVIIMVTCCAVFTPILLKLVFKPSKNSASAYDDLHSNALADKMEEHEQLEIISDKLLTANREAQRQNTNKDK